MMSDKPGRTHASDRSGRRSGMEDGADPIKRDMQDFARELTDRLNSHRLAGDFERLAIFAAPAMLGLLREEMSHALRATVIIERDQNLMSLGEAELRATLKSEIANLRGNASA
jgi:protein required for attachment to host cells